MRPRRLLPFSLLVLSLAGCPHPLRFGPDGEITDARVLLKKLDERAARTLSVKADARVRIRTPQQSGTVGEFIAALRPNALHLETLNFFGKPVGVLVSDGERFSLFLEENGSFYTGPATAENVSRLLPMVFEPREVVMILLGDVPRIPGAETRLELDKDAKAYLLTLRAGTVVQKIWVHTEDLTPARSEIRGINAYDLHFDDYQDFGGVLFPKNIELVSVLPDGTPAGVEIEVKYKDTEVNPPIDLSLFVLQQPPNSTLIQVDELGRAKDGGAAPQAPALPLPLTPEPQPKAP